MVLVRSAAHRRRFGQKTRLRGGAHSRRARALHSQIAPQRGTPLAHSRQHGSRRRSRGGATGRAAPGCYRLERRRCMRGRDTMTEKVPRASAIRVPLPSSRATRGRLNKSCPFSGQDPNLGVEAVFVARGHGVRPCKRARLNPSVAAMRGKGEAYAACPGLIDARTHAGSRKRRASMLRETRAVQEGDACGSRGRRVRFKRETAAIDAQSGIIPTGDGHG
jgi:hypothetical protein